MAGKSRRGRYFTRNRLNILINSESHTYLQEEVAPPGHRIV
ncbi:hypothetical protein AGR7B_Cc270031 [Agrobacterium deltaense RV3]|nr:hypothetical protein AGR7B_Cc270031 [Agrobacterium deltaense RV3]